MSDHRISHTEVTLLSAIVYRRFLSILRATIHGVCGTPTAVPQEPACVHSCPTPRAHTNYYLGMHLLRYHSLSVIVDSPKRLQPTPCALPLEGECPRGLPWVVVGQKVALCGYSWQKSRQPRDCQPLPRRSGRFCPRKMSTVQLHCYPPP